MQVYCKYTICISSMYLESTISSDICFPVFSSIDGTTARYGSFQQRATSNQTSHCKINHRLWRWGRCVDIAKYTENYGNILHHENPNHPYIYIGSISTHGCSGRSLFQNLATSPDYDKPIHVSRDQLTVSMSVETGGFTTHCKPAITYGIYQDSE